MGHRTKHVLRQQLIPVQPYCFLVEFDPKLPVKYLRRVSMEQNRYAAAYMYLRFDVASVRSREI